MITSKDINPVVGDRIGETWFKSGLSQKKFAASIGISTMTLYGYINANYSPTAEVLRRICNTYKVDPAWLLGF